jgi:hypothetical protein
MEFAFLKCHCIYLWEGLGQMLIYKSGDMLKLVRPGYGNSFGLNYIVTKTAVALCFFAFCCSFFIWRVYGKKVYK